MAEIVTIPVEIAETPLTIETIEEAVRDSEPPTPDPNPLTIDISETTTKKKPGRPVGSKSKVPGKPRAPRKVRISEVEVEAVTQQEPREPALQGSRPIPTISHDTRSAMMLSLLAEQARTRQTHKADLWKSWFR